MSFDNGLEKIARQVVFRSSLMVIFRDFGVIRDRTVFHVTSDI